MRYGAYDTPNHQPNLPPLRAGEWRTKDGRTLLIKEMLDSHLTNTLKYMVKNARNTRTWALNRIAKAREVCIFPETATSLDREVQRINETPDLELLIAWNDKFAEMYAEACARNLAVTTTLIQKLIEP